MLLHDEFLHHVEAVAADADEVSTLCQTADLNALRAATLALHAVAHHCATVHVNDGDADLAVNAVHTDCGDVAGRVREDREVGAVGSVDAGLFRSGEVDLR